MSHKLNRQKTEAIINIRAWKDPKFKKKLKDSPHAALKEIGMTKVPKSLVIKTEEEGKNQWVIRLFECPLNLNDLSDEDLEKVAAGEPQEVKCESKCCPKKKRL